MRFPVRPMAAIAIALGTLAGSATMPTPAWAGLLGLLGGAIAVLTGWNATFYPDLPALGGAGGEDIGRISTDLIEALSEPTLVLEGARVLAANPAARRMFGESVAGQDVRLAIRHPAALQGLSGYRGEGVDQIELTGLGGPGRRWLMIVSPLPGGLRLLRFSDRSEAHAAEQMRVDFVANASHELRTPLATILGFVETLRDEEAGGEPVLRQRFLGIMDGEAKRMQVLIDDLISLSRIEAERFRPPTEPVDLLPLVEDVRASCGTLLAEGGNEIQLDNRSHGAIVAGDSGQLLQLLRNLVVNAVKYGRAGAPILVSFEDAGEMVRMTVTDQGEGIAAEHLPRLTERFYRVNAGRSRAQGGTGLGLAIVKHIVWRHRGRLDIRSEPGAGTSVHVLLPRPPSEAAE